jgi:hypothetical protein
VLELQSPDGVTQGVSHVSEARLSNLEEKSARQTRRSFLKVATYVAPAILTLKAAPALASPGSNCNNGPGNGVDCQPPGNPPINDGPGSWPGNPGNRRGRGRGRGRG